MFAYEINYEDRAKEAPNHAARELFLLMSKKRTNLCLADDEVDPKKFIDLAEKIGPEIAVLKTHIDILSEFNPAITKRLMELSKQHNFMIFEDRKFADIGNTVRMQYAGGIYRIADWAHIVNIHIIPGPGIIEGIGEVVKSKNDGMPRGMLILAQMSSEGSLASGDYTKKAVEWAAKYKELVTGYIGNGSSPVELMKLSKTILPGHVLLTPGVQIQGKKDDLKQQYTTPEQAVKAGSDVMIVGRGIYKAEDPLAMARTYRKEGWAGYISRLS